MIYEFFRILGIVLGYPLQLLFFKRKTYYENDKKVSLRKGGKLIISNHYNMFDYVVACFVVFPRKLWAVASEMPFKSAIARFGMKFFGTVQANRETRNMSFINESAKLLKKGYLVQIFPEGRNTPDGTLQPFHRSYVLIAHRANQPIVPVISDGRYGLFKRVRVIIGEEIQVSDFISPDKKTPSKAELEAVNDYVFKKVVELRQRLEDEKNKKKKGNKQ